MKISNPVKLLTLAILGVLMLPAFVQVGPTQNANPVMMSYNPAPANNFHAPLSSAALLGITNATPQASFIASSTSQSNNPSNLKTVQQNALRFIIDDSYFPQSETTIAVNPANPDQVLGGFNDAKFFFCRFLPHDCATSSPTSLSGYTTSTDGGKGVAKSGNLPNINAMGTLMISFGDPSVSASIDGNFFYASLALSPYGFNGIMIAKSNPNLFDPNISCVTSPTLTNPCWETMFVYGSTSFPILTFEDKDRIAVDQNPASPYYRSVYVAWDHFTRFGTSLAYLARCDNDLTKCTMVSGANSPVVSGLDPFVAWTTPAVDSNGNVYLAWCNFGTFTTLGPVACKIAHSSPGGNNFGTPSNILSYMGTGTTLPMDTVIIGWASEQFRIAPGLISLAADTSTKSNNVYFTTLVCTTGHYYRLSSFIFPVADDNPGDCATSAVLLSSSMDGGTTWTSPTTLSDPAVNDQPFVTIDPQTGTVYVLYYTTQYDPFNHRIDVVASVSNNSGKSFHQQRITSVSNEPNSDPNMYAYFVSNGFGGSISVPQYGDYFEATAREGTLWVLFTGNYAVVAGTFQTDPFLAVVNESNQGGQQTS